MNDIKIFLESVSTVLKLFGRSKKYLVFVIGIFFIVALVDMIGISLIGPYVVVFFDYGKLISDYPFLSNFSQQQLIIISSAILISIFLVRAVALWIIQDYILRISFNRQIDLRRMIITSFLSQDYSSRVNKTTAQYQTALMAYCQNFVQSLMNTFRLLVELTSVVLILTLLMVTNLTFFIISGFFAIVGLILMTRIFSRDFVKWGENKNKGLNELVTSMNDVLTGIKEVKILGIGNIFEKKVLKGAEQVAAAERRLYLHSIIPRYILELLLVAIICTLLGVSFFFELETLETLSTLSIFLVAAMRLLPSMNLSIACINGISLNIDGVRNLKSELDEMLIITSNQDVENKANTYSDFNEIKINNLDFNYSDGKSIFSNINLKINKGDFIGISGSSGSGKTTLVDLIMGLNKPTSGSVLIDNSSIHNDLLSWRKQLAYLPQEIFLIDGSIIENICIGHEINNISYKRAEEICKDVGLDTLIKSLPDGINTKIGEKGLKFSGGQRQRIALARAFFNNRKLIFLDESTSALDHDSSMRVISTISKLCNSGLTAILISHNEELLKNCSRIINVGDGGISESSFD